MWSFRLGDLFRLIWLRLCLCWGMLVASAVVCGSFFGFDVMFVYRCDAGVGLVILIWFGCD